MSKGNAFGLALLALFVGLGFGYYWAMKAFGG